MRCKGDTFDTCRLGGFGTAPDKGTVEGDHGSDLGKTGKGTDVAIGASDTDTGT